MCFINRLQFVPSSSAPMLEMLHFGREGRIKHDLLSTLTRPKLDANETSFFLLFVRGKPRANFPLFPCRISAILRGEWRERSETFSGLSDFPCLLMFPFSLLAKIRGPNFGSLASPYLHFTLDPKIHTMLFQHDSETERRVNGARGILHPMSYQGTLSPRRLCLC